VLRIKQIPCCVDASLLQDSAGSSAVITLEDIDYLLSTQGQEMLRDERARMCGTPRKEPLCRPNPIE
jgi:heterodisulfide reductase subunit A-like polyferredoxin